mmetsp:Transcript_9355/g.38259  ORF Transcript_9355/g.38259 Transcript_9355/m.38259 type:complete len:461 (+) Transcript_9355:1140-2522(+)
MRTASGSPFLFFIPRRSTTPSRMSTSSCKRTLLVLYPPVRTLEDCSGSFFPAGCVARPRSSTHSETARKSSGSFPAPSSSPRSSRTPSPPSPPAVSARLLAAAATASLFAASNASSTTALDPTSLARNAHTPRALSGCRLARLLPCARANALFTAASASLTNASTTSSSRNSAANAAARDASAAISSGVVSGGALSASTFGINERRHVASLPASLDPSTPPLNTCTTSSAPPTTSFRSRSSSVTGSATLPPPYLRCASRDGQRRPVTATVNARHGAASAGAASAHRHSASSTARDVACFGRDASRHASCEATWSGCRSARASSAWASKKARVRPRREATRFGSIARTARWRSAIACASGTTPRRWRSASRASSLSSLLLDSESLLESESESPLQSEPPPPLALSGFDATDRSGGFAAALISSSRSASIVCATRHPRVSSLAARSSNTSLAPTTSPAAMRI